MIDTLGLKHVYALNNLSREKALALGAKESVKGGGTQRLYINPPKGEDGARITISYPHDDRVHVYSTFEIPKRLYGHNASLPDEIEAWTAIDSYCADTEKLLDIPFPSDSAIVSSVHFAADFHVGENRILETLSPLIWVEIPRYRPSMVFGGTSIYFQKKGEEICVYSKHHHVLNKYQNNLEAIEASRGNVRVEFRLKNRRGVERCRKRLSLSDVTASHIVSTSVSEFLVSKAIKDIGPKLILSPEDSPPNAAKLIFNAMSGSKAVRMWGMHQLFEGNGRYFYKDPQFGISERTGEEAYRELRKLGAL